MQQLDRTTVIKGKPTSIETTGAAAITGVSRTNQGTDKQPVSVPISVPTREIGEMSFLPSKQPPPPPLPPKQQQQQPFDLPVAAAHRPPLQPPQPQQQSFQPTLRPPAIHTTTTTTTPPFVATATSVGAVPTTATNNKSSNNARKGRRPGLDDFEDDDDDDGDHDVNNDHNGLDGGDVVVPWTGEDNGFHFDDAFGPAAGKGNNAHPGGSQHQHDMFSYVNPMKKVDSSSSRGSPDVNTVAPKDATSSSSSNGLNIGNATSYLSTIEGLARPNNNNVHNNYRGGNRAPAAAAFAPSSPSISMSAQNFAPSPPATSAPMPVTASLPPKRSRPFAESIE